MSTSEKMVRTPKIPDVGTAIMFHLLYPIKVQHLCSIITENQIIIKQTIWQIQINTYFINTSFFYTPKIRCQHKKKWSERIEFIQNINGKQEPKLSSWIALITDGLLTATGT